MPRYAQTGAPVATETEAWTLHDSNEIGRNLGFIPDADGSFVGRAANDSTNRTFNVLGGVLYPIDIKLARSTSAVGVTSILIVRVTR